MKRVAKQVFSVFLTVLYLSGYAGFRAHHCEHLDCECTHAEGCFHFHSDDGCCSDTFTPTADQDCGSDDAVSPAQPDQFMVAVIPDIQESVAYTQVSRFHSGAPPRAGIVLSHSSVRRL